MTHATSYPHDHPALVRFRELLVPAPSGREQAMADVVRARLADLGYAHETDPAGNVLVRLPGERDGPLTCYGAHMDEIGMVVTRVEADGTLRVDRSGGLYPWKLGEGPVTVLGDGEPVTGILSMGSTHVPDAGQRAVTWADVWIVTGLSPQELAAAGVRPGSVAVPTRERRGPVLLGPPADPLVAAWTFDDRMGVVALLRFLERLAQEQRRPRHPTLVAFTVHEEGGGQGAKRVAIRERPEIFIAVDGCPTPPGISLALDGRPGIWVKDRLGHYDHGLVQDLMAAARRAGTELQPAVYTGAASDASLVWASGAACRVACFGHVRENSHGYEVARLAVFDRMVDTLVAYACPP